jgi:hypothetical protein
LLLSQKPVANEKYFATEFRDKSIRIMTDPFALARNGVNTIVFSTTKWRFRRWAHQHYTNPIRQRKMTFKISRPTHFWRRQKKTIFMHYMSWR